MHLNIKALKMALNELNIHFDDVKDFEDAIFAKGDYFVRSSTPFNAESVAALCKDKDCLYKRLQGKITMPKTKSFLDPKGNFEDIFSKSLDFLYPRIVKMNQGERGRNVFIANNDKEFRAALESIFNKDSKHYDYMALVQEYIEPYREFRLVVQGRSIVFAYDRESMKETSPELLHTMKSFSKPVLDVANINWGTIDIIESKTGKLFFLEANTRPSFDGFIESNGDRKIIDLYKKALSA